MKCSRFGVPASQRFAEFLEVWFLNECVRREAGDIVWVGNWTQIVGLDSDCRNFIWLTGSF